MQRKSLVGKWVIDKNKLEVKKQYGYFTIERFIFERYTPNSLLKIYSRIPKELVYDKKSEAQEKLVEMLQQEIEHFFEQITTLNKKIKEIIEK